MLKSSKVRQNGYSQFDNAKISDAYVISTDYSQKSSKFLAEYRVSFVDDVFVRKNHYLII
ncbi:Ca2+-dependent phosphoinositide-specific phospholipase C [Arcicella rosea]|uniref:Uncharacterized protein n=1 Tax=Arcicella rosea TaxID=502909 RepID=A0A841EI75_9BACT|nr:Ca2+-dependent phosphoinositide-specific phospholipase C [Arcicella rosea]MBB6002875.1 hypothetical protein [Arcicella rosea]